MYRKSIFFVFFCLPLYVMADVPKGYYDVVDGKSGNELRIALQSVIDNHKVITYDQLYTLYLDSDSKDNGDVWDMYSSCVWQHSVNKCGSYAQVCDCYNREHSIPQSWFSKAMPMRTDAFHVYPTDGKVNNQRSSNPFGECVDGVILDNNALGRSGSSSFPGYSGVVFEPVDEYKGDFARTYFYMATRYAGQCEAWGHSVFSSTQCGLSDYAVSLFMKWHRMDPVSEKERRRNDAIFGLNNTQPFSQGNRNPFIDYPCLAEYIWGHRVGNKVDISKLMSSYSPEFESSDMSGCDCLDKPGLVLPVNDSFITFPGVSVGGSTSSNLEIKGTSLTASLKIKISGTDSAMFSISTDSVSAFDANRGTVVLVTYSPSSLGSHSALIEISSPDLLVPVKVNVKASSIPSLILPSNTDFYFSQNNIGQLTTAEVMFKAVNISNPITLSIEGDNRASFAFSRYTLSAKEAINGTSVTFSFTPNALGKAVAELVVSCPDFQTFRFPIVGECEFRVLPASDITSNSFTAHWTNAGEILYKLSVFTKHLVADSVTMFDLSEPIIIVWKEAGVQFKQNVYQEADAIRLGTGKGDGFLLIDSLDFQNGGKLSVSAANYGLDNSVLEVVCDGEVVNAIRLNPDFNIYEVIIPNNTKSVILRQGVVGERVLIKTVKLVKTTNVGENVLVAGFPVAIKNATQYKVVNLIESADYFYSVELPDGYVSEEWQVRTTNSNGTDNEFVEAFQLTYYVSDNILYVDNIDLGSEIRIYNPSGILVDYRLNCSSSESFKLQRGVYVLTTSCGKNIKILI